MENREWKIRFVAAKIAEGEWSRHTIETVGISRRTYFDWKSIIEEQGIDALLNRAKPGPKPSFSISKDLEEQILQWRRQYCWGPTRIEGHLWAHYGIHYPHTRIYQLIVERGYNAPIAQVRHTWGKKRWERDHSMSLWQGDWKDTNTEPGPMLTFIDDHARYIVISKRCSNADTESTISVLEKAIRQYGAPEQVLTDNGVQFANNNSEHPSMFTQFCTDHGIEHIKTSKKRPTTTGKIEAFHGRYDQEVGHFKSHDAFIHHWNHSRPHSSLGYLYPIEVFYRDRKRGSAIN
jgi:putative transposase